MYCSVIWFPLYVTDAKEIEKVQKRVTRLVPQLKHKPYSERLKDLNITTLAYRRQRTDMLQVFRIINKIDKIPFESFFQLSTRISRGHCWKLEKPDVNTDVRLNSFSVRVINPWNDLPSEAVNCTTLNSFKTAQEKAWKDREIKYVVYDLD